MMFERSDIGLCLDIYELISFKLGMVKDTTKLYSLICALKTMTFVQGHCCLRMHKLLCSFSHIFID